MGVHIRKIQRNERAGSYILHFPSKILRKWGITKGDALIIEEHEGFAVVRPSGGDKDG